MRGEIIGMRVCEYLQIGGANKRRDRVRITTRDNDGLLAKKYYPRANQRERVRVRYLGYFGYLGYSGALREAVAVLLT